LRHPSTTGRPLGPPIMTNMGIIQGCSSTPNGAGPGAAAARRRGRFSRLRSPVL